MHWGLFIQQAGNSGPTAQVSALGDPLQTHGRFLTNAPRQHHLRPVPVAARPQIVLIPTGKSGVSYRQSDPGGNRSLR